MAVIPPAGCRSFNLICAQNSEGAILFGRKTRGFGCGRLVLPGGKLSDWQLPVAPVMDLMSYDAARETGEETGLDVDPGRFTYSGSLFIGDPVERVVALHRCTTDGILPPGSDEVIDWAYYNEPPYSKTPEDYRLWLPSVLAGKLVMAHLNEERTIVHVA